MCSQALLGISGNVNDKITRPTGAEAQHSGAATEDAKTSEERAVNNGMLWGMVLGPALGPILTLLLFDDYGAGIGIGLSMGIAVGAAYGYLRHRRGQSVPSP